MGYHKTYTIDSLQKAIRPDSIPMHNVLKGSKEDYMEVLKGLDSELIYVRPWAECTKTADFPETDFYEAILAEVDPLPMISVLTLNEEDLYSKFVSLPLGVPQPHDYILRTWAITDEGVAAAVYALIHRTWTTPNPENTKRSMKNALENLKDTLNRVREDSEKQWSDINQKALIRAKAVSDVTSRITGEDSGYVLVNISSSDCGPCVRMEPYLLSLAEAVGDKGKVVQLKIGPRDPASFVEKVDLQKFAKEHNISSVPRYMIFENGQKIKDLTGGGTDAMAFFVTFAKFCGVPYTVQLKTF